MEGLFIPILVKYRENFSVQLNKDITEFFFKFLKVFPCLDSHHLIKIIAEIMSKDENYA